MRKLYIKQKVFKITDHYQVFDQNQNPVYQVDQDFRFIGNKIKVRNLNDNSGFIIDRHLLTFLPTYDVFFSTGKSYKIKQKFTLLRKEIEVLSNDYDIRLKGNFWDYTFEVYNSSELIGLIRKEYFAWGDTFEITVLDEEFEDELLSLFIVVDDIQDREN